VTFFTFSDLRKERNMSQAIAKPSFFDRVKANFTTTALVMIPILAGINLVGGWLASTLKLPIFLDMIGTILAAALAGPWVAAVVGLLTNVFLALVANPVYLPYALVSITVGLLTGYMVQKGLFRNWGGVAITWIANTLASVIVASAITIWVFGGATGATGTSFLTAYLIATGTKIFASVVTSQFIFTLLDRAIAYVVAFLVLQRIPSRFVSQVVKPTVK
jgi:energy-coupling factor transport system substrate-specific component